MRLIARMTRWFAAVAVASMLGIVPACGTMGGGGGMKGYFTDAPAAASDA